MFESVTAMLCHIAGGWLVRMTSENSLLSSRHWGSMHHDVENQASHIRVLEKAFVAFATMFMRKRKRNGEICHFA